MLTDSQREALTGRLRRGRENLVSQIPRRPAGLTDLPLSYGQEQLWFIDRFAPGKPTYNIPRAVALSGPLDTGALAVAIDGLIARHEALRTRLVASADGGPVQIIDPPASSPPQLVDLSRSAPEDRQARLREFIGIEALRPFDLATGPLLRTWLLRLTDQEHVLLLVVHHTVFDGWSAKVLIEDLAALYRAGVTCEPSGLAELAVQFADYAVWERDRLDGVMLTELEDYWRGVLGDFETLAFPTDRPRPVLDEFDGALAAHMTGLNLLSGLRELSRQAGTTLFVTLMAGLQALLYRYTGQTDFVVGTASANRSRSELAPLIGFLVNTLPIRADLAGDPTFTELLERVQQATVGAYGHQDLPFGKLVETLGVERDLSRAPIFQIAMTYAERDTTPVHAADVDLVLTDLVVGINAAKFDLDFLAEARADGLWFECAYKTALFDGVSVRRLLGNLGVLLAGAAADPGARLSQLPVLTAAELRQELTGWNDTAATFPVICIHQGFEAQAARTPGAVAAEYDGQRITYAELDRQASQIARRLGGLGAGPEILTGVCMCTGLRRLAALLGIWKAGGGYVPLDPALPADRLAFLITDTAMTILITDQPSTAAATAAAAASAGPAVLCLDAEWDQIRALDPASPAAVPVTPSNVAYVIYTSGSTGRPKGVIVEHRQAINFLHGMIRAWHITPASAILQFAAFTFDVSVMDMFMPLLAGARVILAQPDTLHSPPRLAALIRDRHVTFACLPPAVLTLLTGQHFPELRTLLSAGEELTSELLRGWLRDDLDIYNGYGPTEASIGATFMKLDHTTPLPPPIGRPKPNYRAYILDSHLNPVPVGVTGELHIGGHGVARGYLNRPDLTRARFIADPFTPGQRLYKTGDLARRRPDGTIAFVGRIDNQVKIRGLRIEPGEIETALLTHPHITAAVVTVISTTAGDKQLAAYLQPPPGTTPDPASIRAHLARTLPAYMIPAHLTTLDALPLTPHGKIDKTALPPPQPQPVAGQVGPATLIETMMVDLYATVLNADQVGATDNFFDLGGSSLLAMRLITMIDTELEVNVGAAAVFLAPTPRQLAALLRDEHGFEDADLSVDGSYGLGEIPDDQPATALTATSST